MDPSGENARLRISRPCAPNGFPSSFRVVTSQSAIVPSVRPAASVWPSGLSARSSANGGRDVSLGSGEPSFDALASSRSTWPFWSDAASVLPSRLSATAITGSVTLAERGRNVRT